MEDKNLLFEQYKLYYEMKEKYTDRNFTTNKFYLLVVIMIFTIMFFTKDYSFKYISANLIMSIIGFIVSFFWWANVDTYNLMIKVKLKNVLDEMEKHLPFQIHATEMENFVKLKDNKKLIVFSDMQKGLALAMILIFFCLLLSEITFPFLTLFYNIADKKVL